MSGRDIFLLTDTKILSGITSVPTDDGIFLLFQSAGCAEIIRDGESTSLSEHEVFVGDAKKSYTVTVPDSARTVFLSVKGELLRSLSELYELRDGFTVSAPEAAELFEEMLLIPEKKLLTEKEKQAFAALTLHRLLYTLHRSLGTRLVRRAALRIREYLDLHAEEKTELSELSKVFFMSKTQIHRLFKDEYGVSPIKYLIDRKIDVSKKLLENGELKISDIAEALSFSDARHFSKTFFNRVGMLPSEYRKNKQ